MSGQIPAALTRLFDYASHRKFFLKNVPREDSFHPRSANKATLYSMPHCQPITTLTIQQLFARLPGGKKVKLKLFGKVGAKFEIVDQIAPFAQTKLQINGSEIFKRKSADNLHM